ncbi:MAG: DUF1192 family protein [Methyloligellaceae bacterium]
MDFEDDQVKKVSGFTSGADLSNFSVDELEALLVLIESEKARIEREISSKKSQKLAADSFFKK